jgi:hypothetical protein
MSRHHPGLRRPPGRTRALAGCWAVFLVGLLVGFLLLANGHVVAGPVVLGSVYLVLFLGLVLTA